MERTKILNNRQRISLVLFMLAKGSGIMGVIETYANHRTLAGIFLVDAAVLLVACIILCLWNMRLENRLY